LAKYSYIGVKNNTGAEGVIAIMTKLLKPEEVAERLSLALSTIRKWIHLGFLPVVHLGRRAVRIREEDCEALARLGKTGLPLGSSRSPKVSKPKISDSGIQEKR
jgi:excisionase family DNA binding protein